MKYKITLVSDNPNSWILPYTKELKKALQRLGHLVKIVSDSKKITPGDIAVFLSCEKIVGQEVLKKNNHNLVVHESALPKGRGWSPLTWQILEGKNKIPISLFEAELAVDSGEIYLQDYLNFKGDELVDELRTAQGNKTIEMILKFVKNYPKAKGKKQSGKATYYSKRKAVDSELDPHKTIAEQFGLLRVVDNERYPAFFNYKSNKYIIKIYKANHEKGNRK